ncbi:hypothetical protein DL96DRAFT_895625 [Flagelloscypha sp. PMI_526]|nr:hypothetical protein DL96DRAFT_895625 [Flagelloscypha sp. PMI_526]
MEDLCHDGVATSWTEHPSHPHTYPSLPLFSLESPNMYGNFPKRLSTVRIPSPTVIHPSYSSGIEALPHELQQKIFLLLVLAHFFSDIRTFSSFDKRSTLLILSHVCRSWRMVVLDHPLLWSYILATGPLRPELVDLWLRRSGNMGLTVSLSRVQSQSTQCEVCCDNNVISVRLIANHSSRWVSLTIKSRALDNPALLELTPGSLPQLRKFFWHTSSFTIDPTLNHILQIVSTDSQVETAWINHIPSEMPWNQLLELRLFGVDLSTKMRVLGRMQNLTSLSWIRAGGNLDIHLSSPVNFPRLTTLRVNSASPNCSGIFDAVTLPSLSDLHFSTAWDWSDELPVNGYHPRFVVFGAICELLARSGCHLHRIFVSCTRSGARIPEATLTKFLSDSVLRYLEVACLPALEPTIGNFWAHLQGDFLPTLRELYVATKLDTYQESYTGLQQSDRQFEKVQFGVNASYLDMYRRTQYNKEAVGLIADGCRALPWLKVVSWSQPSDSIMHYCYD